MTSPRTASPSSTHQGKLAVRSFLCHSLTQNSLPRAVNSLLRAVNRLLRVKNSASPKETLPGCPTLFFQEKAGAIRAIL
ncbi:MAG: hypothetical protein NTV33_04875 [Coprothermobacterota bacterium]|nr:hypothetical protein [Coprothermobacterota bacterium]